jgi:hypothetical protein
MGFVMTKTHRSRDEIYGRIGLGFVDKGEICKRRAINAFNREWQSTKNRDQAYKRGEEALESCIQSVGIGNKGAITGLKAELLYYSMAFKTQHLSPESAAGLHSDFRGVIRSRPSAIDVTTTPGYKKPDKFLKVREAFGKAWDYYVGIIDLKNPNLEIYPLLLPVCDDGNLGHLILVIDTDNPMDLTSDHQMLVRYNPYAPDDDEALERVERDWNFVISNPSMILGTIPNVLSFQTSGGVAHLFGLVHTVKRPCG